MYSYKVIDINSWQRKKTYEYFKTFSNPCYGFDVEMDIDKLYRITKETKTSFFVNFTYILTLGLNSIDELRTRIVGDEVVVFDSIDPTYTIMTEEGYFVNGGNVMSNDYQTFYQRCRAELDLKKTGKALNESYNDDTYDKYYMTCIPWLEYTSMTHPIPDKSVESQSVPRTCFSKYYLKDGKMKIKLNITVSHVLCDGYALSKAFNKIQELLDNCDQLLK